MALADGVSFVAASTGTGTFVFSAERESYLTLAQAHAAGEISDGQTVSYLAVDSLSAPTQREWGHGTYSLSGNSIARTTVLGAVNIGTPGTSAINFSVAPTVFLTALAEDIRTILAANTAYYVATTGSDSDDGSSGTPWATIQHAMDFISSKLDFAGFSVTVNIGSGSFAGFGLKGTIGGGILQFVGAGSGSTTLTDGPNDGVHNLGENFSAYVDGTGTQIGLDKVKLSNANIQNISIQGYGWNIFFATIADQTLDLVITGAAGGFVGQFYAGESEVNVGFLFDGGSGSTGTYEISRSGVELLAEFFIVKNFSFNFLNADSSGASYTVSGTPTYDNAFVHVSNSKVTNVDAATWTGSITGAQFNLAVNGILNDTTNGYPPNWLPGSGWVIDQSSSYSGVTGMNVVYTVATLPSGFAGEKAFVSDASAPTFGSNVAGSGAVTVPVYYDGANWVVG